VAQRPLGAERRQRAVDQARVARGERGAAEAERLQRARPHVLDEDVGGLETRVEAGEVVGLPEVEDHGLLAGVRVVEDGAGAVEERRAPAARVAAAVGPSDLATSGARERRM